MIIWLASYPKSGNTWLRSILSSLLYSKDGNFDFEQIYKIKQFPTREYFKQFTEKYHDVHELKKYWIPAQDLISLQNKIAFLKTHHINCKIDNYAFTNSDNTLATIYIVRDPRNLVKSFTNHYSMDKDKATKFITTPTPSFSSGHLGIENKNNNINKEILKIINFLKEFIEIDANAEKIKNIIATTAFENLKNLEKKHDFLESPRDKNDKKVNKSFFYLGKENKWEKFLDDKNRLIIEKELKDLMTELNYL